MGVDMLLSGTSHGAWYSNEAWHQKAFSEASHSPEATCGVYDPCEDHPIEHPGPPVPLQLLHPITVKEKSWAVDLAESFPGRHSQGAKSKMC